MTMATAVSRQLLRLHPEPGRFWIVWSPRTWRCAEGVWTDLAGGRLLGFQGRPDGALPELELGRVDELFYLPPAAGALSDDRDRLAAEVVAGGAPVLMALEPGEQMSVAGAGVVWDLAPVLIAGEVDRLAEVPAGGVAVWPLVPGLTDSPDLQEYGCALLADAGVRVVQPLAVEIDPVVRRCLAEESGDESVFRALFHGSPPSERAFARCAVRHGLAIYTDRPPLGGSRQAGNRRIAAALALAGDLWLRLGRLESAGQALFLAARGADATGYDLSALAREGNLHVLDWLGAAEAAVVADVAASGESSLVRELLAEYLGPETERS